MEEVKKIIGDVLQDGAEQLDVELSLVGNGMSSIQLLTLHKALKDHFPEKKIPLRVMPNLTPSQIEKMVVAN